MIKYLAAHALSASAEIKHGFFTRNGGVSSGVYDSLNCARGSNDASENVIKNLESVRMTVGAETLRTMRQIHAHTVWRVTDKAETSSERPEADGAVTNIPGVALGVLTADCAPVLFADPVNRVIGAAHAGRKGAVGCILQNVIREMIEIGAERKNILAAIGPSISAENYEVGSDIKEDLLALSSKNEQFFSNKEDNKIHFDLPGFVLSILQEQNIRAENLNVCTYAREKDFFSYRRTTHHAEKDFGRQISVIVLN